jgi:hypothetical protein
MAEEPEMYKYRYLGIIGGGFRYILRYVGIIVVVVLVMHELMRYVIFCCMIYFV